MRTLYTRRSFLTIAAIGLQVLAVGYWGPAALQLWLMIAIIGCMTMAVLFRHCATGDSWAMSGFFIAGHASWAILSANYGCSMMVASWLGLVLTLFGISYACWHSNREVGIGKAPAILQRDWSMVPSLLIQLLYELAMSPLVVILLTTDIVETIVRAFRFRKAPAILA